MIEEIRITSLGVIDESVLELGPGLNVVTDADRCVERVVALRIGRRGVLQHTVDPQLDRLVRATFGAPD
mgnify:CR=1 FL=1